MITVTQTTFETSNIKGSSTCSISCCFCKCSSNSATTTTPLISSSSSTAVVAVAVVIMAVVVVVIDSNLILFIYLFIKSRHGLHKYSSFYHFPPLKSFIRICFLYLYAIKHVRCQCIGMIWAREYFLLKICKN